MAARAINAVKVVPDRAPAFTWMRDRVQFGKLVACARKIGGGPRQMWLAQPKDREKPALLVVFSPRRGRATGGRVGENLAMVSGWRSPPHTVV